MDIGFLHLETRSAVVRWLTWTQIVTQRMRGLEFPNTERLLSSLEFPLFLLSKCADSIPVAELRSDATAFFLQLILRTNCNHQTRKCPKGWAVSQSSLQAEKRSKKGVNIHRLLNHPLLWQVPLQGLLALQVQGPPQEPPTAFTRMSLSANAHDSWRSIVSFIHQKNLLKPS